MVQIEMCTRDELFIATNEGARATSPPMRFANPKINAITDYADCLLAVVL